MTAQPRGSTASAKSPVSIRRVESTADRGAFVDLPYRAYRDLPEWRAPLRFERAAQVDLKSHPALAQMPHALMLAVRDGEVVGRIAAFLNPAHLAHHQDQTGHFGFLDTLYPDPDIIGALMGAAESFVRDQGMVRIAGPFNFSVNEECGLLVEGFDTPPVFMMLHGRPDYARALENLGYAKAMDMHAYLMRFGDQYRHPPIVDRLLDGHARSGTMSMRCLDMQNYEQEIRLVLDIFDDAWSGNWGFVPFGEAEIAHMAKELKPVIRPDNLWIGLIDGEPAGFTLVLPDLNEAAHGLDGRLLPFGWAQFLYNLKIKGTRTGRMLLAGIRRKHHKSRRGLQTMAAICNKVFEVQHARGMRNIEASWVLETNRDLVSLIQLFDAPRYKTYRIYEKPL